VFFSNCSHQWRGFLDTAEIHTLRHSIDVKQSQTPNPSQTERFGTPHKSGELRRELVVWNYPSCCQVDRSGRPAPERIILRGTRNWNSRRDSPGEQYMRD
jgi:hypothetical protein